MNSLVRAQGTAVGTMDGNWMWDGTNWVCVPCGDGVPPFPCPPPGFPPPGCPPWFSGANSPPWYPGANAGVSFGNTAPPNPVRGHFWWNGSALGLFDGAVWVNTATGGIIGEGGGSGQGTVIISATAPGNPVAGMQWWDGSVMRVYDGTQWNVVGPGGSAGPVPTTTLSFAITAPAQLAITPNAWTVVPFTTTPLVDTTLGWDPITRRFTPKRGGVYGFDMRGFLTYGAGGSAGIALVKNDDGSFNANSSFYNVVAISTSANASGSLAWQQSSGNTVMNGTTDFVRLFAYSSAGTVDGAGQNPLIAGWQLP
jgi:hypothetical protein